MFLATRPQLCSQSSLPILYLTMPSQGSLSTSLYGSQSTGIDARSLTDSRPANYAKRAGIAASYPLRGIWYFLRNKEFWPLFSGRLLPLSLISFFVYFILFTFAFLPQFAFLAIFHGWGAWVNAVVLTLGEGLIIIQGLFEGFFVDECRVDVFDVSYRNAILGLETCWLANALIRQRSLSWA